jgi:hypothetical protein
MSPCLKRACTTSGTTAEVLRSPPEWVGRGAAVGDDRDNEVDRYARPEGKGRVDGVGVKLRGRSRE